MTDLIYAIGDIFYAFFGVFEKLGNLPNVIFIALGFVGLFFWLNMQKKFNKDANNSGALK